VLKCQLNDVTETTNLCNENPLDTLFIRNLYRQTTSTCFGHIYCPSSGGIQCICTVIVTCYTRVCLGDWQVGQFDSAVSVRVSQPQPALMDYPTSNTP
jgi:hypothetical protein